MKFAGVSHRLMVPRSARAQVEARPHWQSGVVAINMMGSELMQARTRIPMMITSYVSSRMI